MCVGLPPRFHFHMQMARGHLELHLLRYDASVAGGVPQVASTLKRHARGWQVRMGSAVDSRYPMYRIRHVPYLACNDIITVYDCMRHVKCLGQSASLARGYPRHASMPCIQPLCLLLTSRATGSHRKLGLGVAVGVFATLFNSPFDVVKSRVQSQLPGQNK